jgi:outer membrane protein assembly factor BamA
MPDPGEILTSSETRLTRGAYSYQMVRILGLALALCGIVAAQDKFPLRAIEIVGAENYSEQSIIAASGLKIGDLVGEADFKQALERISAAGVFDGLEWRYDPQGDGYKVTFTVHELEQLYPVEFQGFDDSPDELKAFLAEKIPLFAPRLPSTGPLIDRIGDALQTRWQSQGHESRVIGQLEAQATGGLVMLFRPQERLRTISLVTFENTEVISAFDLQSFFNRIARGEEYSETRLGELLRYNVRPLYEEKGRMGVKFCPCTTDDDPDNLGLRVRVQVDEGPEYVYGAVPPPEIAAMDPEKIESMYSPKAGATVNMKQARESQAAIEEMLRANGFIRARTQLDVKVNDEAKTVDLAFLADPGYRYAFDRLVIEGLDILAEPIIRKRWGMASGAPYSPKYPGFFLSRLQEENAFENLQDTRFKEDVDETTKRVTVTLQFIGQTKKRLYPAAASDPVQDPF